MNRPTIKIAKPDERRGRGDEPPAGLWPYSYRGIWTASLDYLNL